MEADRYEFAKQYHNPEFATVYSKDMMTIFQNDERSALEYLHQVFNSGTLNGTKLLEVGCGPTIHKIASASKQFTDITLGEYSEECRNLLKKWLKKDPDAIDWTVFLKIVAELESYKNKEGIREIEDRIRSSVKSVVYCDVLADSILPADVGLFDVIVTSFCLEIVPTTPEDYLKIVAKVSSYIKKEGYLVMLAGLNVKDAVFGKRLLLQTIPINEELIYRAVTEAGLEIIDFKTQEKQDGEGKDAVKYSGLAFTLAKKL